MELSSDLVSQFVKATAPVEEPKKETTVYGTVVIDGKTYVRLDGSELLTPVATTSSVKDGDRVTVMIKNHSAVVTGNLADPSASSGTVTEVDNTLQQFGVVVAKKITTTDLTAINASLTNLLAQTAKIQNVEAGTIEALEAKIRELQATFADFENLTVDDLKATTAEVESVEATFGTFVDLETDVLDAVTAEITNLKGYTAAFTKLSTQELDTVKANIRDLNTKNATIENLDATYANIDFANIDEAAVQKIFSDSGIIKDLIVSDGKITGELVGVTIKGDLIEGGTVKADKLVVQGTDGLYYKLNVNALGETEAGKLDQTELQNGLHGSTLIKKSIVAEKIAVDDLVAFGATIGGFHITPNTIYSGVKSSLYHPSSGIYLDKLGQIMIGDGGRGICYRRTGTQYALDISADHIQFKSSNLKVGARNLIRNSETLDFSKYRFITEEMSNEVYIIALEEQSTILNKQEEYIGPISIVSAASAVSSLEDVLEEQALILERQNSYIKEGG